MLLENMLKTAKDASVARGAMRSRPERCCVPLGTSKARGHVTRKPIRTGHDTSTPLTPHVPAPVRHIGARTSLQAPTAALQASHTSISLPLGPIDLFGNYSVLGPAVIRKINNVLVAMVQPGGAISVLSSGNTPTYMDCASLSHDDDLSAVVNLAGQHLELQGSFELHDMQRTIKHDGKVIVSPGALSEDSCILLLPGGTVSHPVNVHPQHSL